jgi:hypothetical protein
MSRLPSSHEEETIEEAIQNKLIDGEPMNEGWLAREQQNESSTPNEKNQYRDVATMYNAIVTTIKGINEYTAQFETIRDNTTARIDALPVKNAQKRKLRSANLRLVNMIAVISQNTAQVMMMEEFVKIFCSEWKRKKKGIADRREMFLKEKTKEIEKAQRGHRRKLTKSLWGAGMRFPEFEGTDGSNEGPVENETAIMGKDMTDDQEVVQDETAELVAERPEADENLGQDLAEP